MEQRARRRAVERALVEQKVSPEVAESYLDVWGKEKRIDAATREALQRALGRARRAARVELHGGRCYQPEMLEQGGRVWGFMVQLYGLRSKRNWASATSATCAR